MLIHERDGSLIADALKRKCFEQLAEQKRRVVICDGRAEPLGFIAIATEQIFGARDQANGVYQDHGVIEGIGSVRSGAFLGAGLICVDPGFRH